MTEQLHIPEPTPEQLAEAERRKTALWRAGKAPPERGHEHEFARHLRDVQNGVGFAEPYLIEAVDFLGGPAWTSASDEAEEYRLLADFLRDRDAANNRTGDA